MLCVWCVLLVLGILQLLFYRCRRVLLARLTPCSAGEPPESGITFLQHFPQESFQSCFGEVWGHEPSAARRLRAGRVRGHRDRRPAGARPLLLHPSRVSLMDSMTTPQPCLTTCSRSNEVRKVAKRAALKPRSQGSRPRSATASPLTQHQRDRHPRESMASPPRKAIDAATAALADSSSVIAKGAAKAADSSSAIAKGAVKVAGEGAAKAVKAADTSAALAKGAVKVAGESAVKAADTSAALAKGAVKVASESAAKAADSSTALAKGAVRVAGTGAFIAKSTAMMAAQGLRDVGLEIKDTVVSRKVAPEALVDAPTPEDVRHFSSQTRDRACHSLWPHSEAPSLESLSRARTALVCTRYRLAHLARRAACHAGPRSEGLSDAELEGAACDLSNGG